MWAALLYARERRLLLALTAVLAFYAAAPLWAAGWLPVLTTGSGGGHYVRAVIIVIMGASLALILTMSRSLGECESLRGRRVVVLRAGHAAVAIGACVVSVPVLAVLSGPAWAVQAAGNALGLLGIGAATAALTRAIPAWLPVLVAVLGTWMVGMQVPEDIPQPWAWLMVAPPEPTGVVVNAACATAGLALWIALGPKAVVGDED